ncbi:MAG: phosphoadenylyl-sulfate reductase [Acidimicrobiia bacterium]
MDRLSTDELIIWALHRPGRAAISCGFQASGLALLHMVRRYEPDIPVLFVDTGYHFPETLAFRDRLVREWELNLVDARPQLDVAEQEAHFGLLHRTDPDRCCALRKVEPLYRALGGFDVWFTGLRRDQAPTRAAAGRVERRLLPSGRVIDKVNPLADWTFDEVRDYLAVHDIPHHPLYDRGYPSIGCAPCTERPADPDNPRSGRWGGVKLECGIHTLAGEAP